MDGIWRSCLREEELDEAPGGPPSKVLGALEGHQSDRIVSLWGPLGKLLGLGSLTPCSG